jgi:hypothetical protein
MQSKREGKRPSKGRNGSPFNATSHRSHPHHRPQRSPNKLIAMMHETTQNTYAGAERKDQEEERTTSTHVYFPGCFLLACLHTPTFSVFAQSKKPRCFFSSHLLLVHLS